MKILVVDDSRVVRELLIAYLTNIYDNNCVIEEAASGQEALDQYESFLPDIMLLDYQLPDLDGLKVIKQLSENYKHIPVIMVTGNNDVQLVVEAMYAGVQGYILKESLSNEAISWAIEDVLQKIRMRKKIEKQQEDLHNFTLTITHDLSDQISSVQSALMLIHPDSTPDKIRKFKDLASSVAESMQDFVQELFDYSTLTSKPTVRTSFPLGAMLEEITVNLKHICKS